MKATACLVAIGTPEGLALLGVVARVIEGGVRHADTHRGHRDP